MKKEKSLERVITILAKLSLPEAIELYNSAGVWLHERITMQQKELSDQVNNLEKQKLKIKSDA